jgi:hypothetical protein
MRPQHYTETVTLEELHVLKRIRQLLGQGADIIIIEKRGEKPVVRQVGKAEG